METEEGSWKMGRQRVEHLEGQERRCFEEKGDTRFSST